MQARRFNTAGLPTSGAFCSVVCSSVQYQLYYTVAVEEHIVEVPALWHTSRGTKPRL